MKHRTSTHVKKLPAIAGFLILSHLPLLAQNPPSQPIAESPASAANEEALRTLGAAADQYVIAFNNRNAAGIAAMFVPDGVIAGSNEVTLTGRSEIEAYHQKLFSGEKVPQMALEATDVHFVTPEMAIENGVVYLTNDADEPVRSIGYTTIHAKQADGTWLMAASRSFPEVITPAEQIKPLHWMIGEWTLEGDTGVRIDMTMHLDDSGNFILGEALVSDPSNEALTIQLRIGWNPATSSVYWWTFDSEGGNASGHWVHSGSEWITHTTGITADAEPNSSTQRIHQDGDAMEWVATQRVLAGKIQPDVSFRFVRRAPDAAALIEADANGE